jgi:hypothetical protein
MNPDQNEKLEKFWIVLPLKYKRYEGHRIPRPNQEMVIVERFPNECAARQAAMERSGAFYGEDKPTMVVLEAISTCKAIKPIEVSWEEL